MFAVPVVQAQAASPSIPSLINNGSSVLNAIGVGDQVIMQSDNPPSSHTQPTTAHCAANQTTIPSDCPGFDLGSLLAHGMMESVGRSYQYSRMYATSSNCRYLPYCYWY